MSDTYEPAKCKNCQHESSKISWPPVGSTVKCSHCGHEEIVQSIILDNYRETLTGSSLSMGENVGWIKGPHDAVKAVQKLIIDGEDYRSDIRNLGEALQSMTLDCAAKIEEIDELRNQIDKQTKKFLDDFNVRADLNRGIWKLKQLFVDLTFCYLNPEMSKTLYADTNKEFKEIIGDDPEFVDIDKFPNNN